MARVDARPAAAPARPGRCVAALPALLLLAPTVAGNLLVDAHYHRPLAQTGGKSSFSASIYELARFLDTPKGDRTPSITAAPMPSTGG